ncbi:MAG TPA: ATP-binding protein [Acidimicrobiia bacterium]
MTDRALVGLLRAVVVVGAALGIVTSATIVVTGESRLFLTEGGAFALFSVFFAVVVWMVVPQQPRNKVIWIMAATALASGVYQAAWTIALTIDPTVWEDNWVPADVSRSAAWVLMATPFATGAIVAQLTFGFLLFPDGSLPSPRWRPVGGLAAFATVFITLQIAWSFRPWSTVPIDEGGLANVVGNAVVVLAALLSLVALAGRFRRSRGVTRQQFKWVLWGASVLILSLMTLMIFVATLYADFLLALFALAGAVFVVSYAIAVGKYRLYDIEVVISRTVVYGTLAVFITGVYVAAVLGVGRFLGVDSESSPWLAIGATAVVAFAFEPLRERLQRLANRLVYGKRATPYEVLSDFSRKITATDEELLDQVARSLAEGTTAAAAAVWVKRDGTLDRVAVWPRSRDDPPVRATTDDATIPEADLTKPVIHDGEFLGALTLSAARGQSLVPTDDRLLQQMASGMGLALRNIRLSEDLRGQVEKLRLSRQRLVTVQDETRRHLERQLHDGAQQRLVALKVRLTLTRKRAEAFGVGEVADLLDHVAIETDRAIDSLRDFARGIYPPLLEAEGPAAALTSQTQKLPIQVTVHAAGVNRHQRSVEEAVYFCVLEALQNVVKHAEATSAHVALHETGDSLTFEVSDDGRGFDPTAVKWGSGLANLADRLDALGGTLEVTSAPGKGTLILGRIPSRQVETVA